MTIADGYHALAPGRLATIVTFLEMTAAPVLPETPAPAGVTLEAADPADVDGYRALFLKIGADYLWWSRLADGDDALRGILAEPTRAIFIARREGAAIGLIEFDFRDPADAELAFFGLVPQAIGGGTGRWLMTEGLRRAWARPDLKRLYVHTCHFDSPQAIGFYIRSGFRPYDTQIEVFEDPRLAGILPRDAAPQVPLAVRPA
ncbi:GNAT family N-acetyltransferase [Methylobrevis pamukkalensis]|uniref:N-acetyltransferase domain-containing protein n=1 Tax=Methylobrevis pamukkalensis TaxID=1439726 RepID=A0A1E3H134_9HYPH|nr:GNAT family N-acetyltransferase [Methylobrevis pamukkalensis]ODN70017.1 hypothetical protein A6302_02673 [Methylobrevis pamukkalensis]